MTQPTFAEGDACRIRNMRGTFRIQRFHLAHGEVTVWGGLRHTRSMRTVTTDRLMPMRPGDVAPERIPEMAAPARKAGRR